MDDSACIYRSNDLYKTSADECLSCAQEEKGEKKKGVEGKLTFVNLKMHSRR